MTFIVNKNWYMFLKKKREKETLSLQRWFVTFWNFESLEIILQILHNKAFMNISNEHKLFLPAVLDDQSNVSI